MVLGLITAIAACPAIVGTTEAVRQGQRSNAKERHRGRKTNIVASCASTSPGSKQIDGGTVILSDQKVRKTCKNMCERSSETKTIVLEKEADVDRVSGIQVWVAVSSHDDTSTRSGHPFAGYFLPYPNTNWGRKGEGLVSTISNDPPQLNWIYVDEETYELKYGNRVESEDHIVGPWDCTRIDKRLTLEGWEGFMAVQESKGSWALYFDRDDDGLKGKVVKKRILEVELIRKERRKGKDDDPD
ncbi:MAG: hypothetical protein M1837_001409 [Sclerophora amabilis]|nr:MAG: hypothetical protein M1837_001409 [Sclerophora amabilis]